MKKFIHLQLSIYTYHAIFDFLVIPIGHSFDGWIYFFLQSRKLLFNTILNCPRQNKRRCSVHFYMTIRKVLGVVATIDYRLSGDSDWPLKIFEFKLEYNKLI